MSYEWHNDLSEAKERAAKMAQTLVEAKTIDLSPAERLSSLKATNQMFHQEFTRLTDLTSSLCTVTSNGFEVLKTDLLALTLIAEQIGESVPEALTRARILERRITDLYLMNTRLRDISELQYLTALKELHIEGTFVENLAPLQNLQQLTKLSLQRTPVQDISPIASLHTLKNLDLSSTEVKDFEPLVEARELQELCLGGTAIQDLTPLSGLVNLRKLNLWRTKIHNITPLQDLPNLKEVFVPSCALAPESMPAIKNMRARSIKFLW